nr:hypothetical protein CFP56_21983 [Quercus suber]
MPRSSSWSRVHDKRAAHVEAGSLYRYRNCVTFMFRDGRSTYTRPFDISCRSDGIDCTHEAYDARLRWSGEDKISITRGFMCDNCIDEALQGSLRNTSNLQ